MDFFVSGFLLWLIEIFSPKTQQVQSYKARPQKARNQDLSLGAAFFYGTSDMGIKQKGSAERDPYLNEDYNDGPDW